MIVRLKLGFGGLHSLSWDIFLPHGGNVRKPANLCITCDQGQPKRESSGRNYSVGHVRHCCPRNLLNSFGGGAVYHSKFERSCRIVNRRLNG
jgi:hypothetical protein